MARRPIVGTGWKMNLGAAETVRYAEALLSRFEPCGVEVFVLPPFTSLAAAVSAFAGSGVGVGAQNMHWDRAGAWTGEISAPMLVEAGCRYVELAHAERLAHFGETYALVRRKLDTALKCGLTPILCLGETAAERRDADEVLRWQLTTALGGQIAARVPDVVFAYEPRWAIGATEAASPDYVADRHAAIRSILRENYGVEAAAQSRIIYGGSVNATNGPTLIALADVDGLFAGRFAWTPDGLTSLIRIVAQAAL